MGPLVLPQHLLNLDSSPSPTELLFQLMSPLLLPPELTIWLPRVSSMEEFTQLLQLLLLQLCPMPLLQFLMLLLQYLMLLLQFLMVMLQLLLLLLPTLATDMLQLMATLVPSTSTLSSLLTPMELLSQLMSQLLLPPVLTILPPRDCTVESTPMLDQLSMLLDMPHMLVSRPSPMELLSQLMSQLLLLPVPTILPPKLPSSK